MRQVVWILRTVEQPNEVKKNSKIRTSFMNGPFCEAPFVNGGNTLTHSPKHVKDRVEGRKGSSYWVLV